MRPAWCRRVTWLSSTAPCVVNSHQLKRRVPLHRLRRLTPAPRLLLRKKSCPRCAQQRVGSLKMSAGQLKRAHQLLWLKLLLHGKLQQMSAAPAPQRLHALRQLLLQRARPLTPRARQNGIAKQLNRASRVPFQKPSRCAAKWQT